MINHAFIRPDSRLAAEFWEKGRVADCPVYDMHGHMGVHGSIFFPACEAEQMIQLMDRAGVRKLCFSHHHSLWNPAHYSSESVEEVKKYGDRFGIYIAVNPHYPEQYRDAIKHFDQWRPLTVGVKLLADYHKVAVDDCRYQEALEFAEAKQLPVLYHTWTSSPFDGPAAMRKVVEKYPHITHILGHSFNNDWQSAVDLVREHSDHVYLELTSIPGLAGVLEFFRDKIGTKRILFGTDLPWFDEHQAIGGLLSTRLSDDELRDIFYRNARRVLKEAPLAE